MILAATVPAAAGRLYHITDGEDVTCREVLDAVAGALGVPAPRRSVPFRAVYLVAALLEGVAKAVRSSSPPPITRYGARLLACDCRYDIGRARRELGYRPRPASLAIRDAVRWWQTCQAEPAALPETPEKIIKAAA